MENIKFTDEEGNEVLFYVLEQAKLSGKNYILVTDDEESEEAEALILRENEAGEKGEVMYEIVDDDDELNALSTLFESLLEDVDIR